MSALKDRRHRLLTVLRQQDGPIRTGDVMRLYRQQGWGPSRTTARRDLQFLARRGLLVEHGPLSDRRYMMTRRGWLLAAIRAAGQPVTTHSAELLMVGSPWPTAGRNTVRKDLRALGRHGHLAPAVCGDRRFYTTKDCA